MWFASRIVTELFDDQERRELCQLHVETPPRGSSFLERLADAAHYRIQTVRKLPLARQAELLLRFLGKPRMETEFRLALREFHLQRRANIMAAALDIWGIQHKNGRIDATVKYRIPTESDARRAATILESQFGNRHVAAYYATVGLVMGESTPAWRTALWPVADDIAVKLMAPSGAPARAAPRELPTVEQERTESDLDHFTTLDNVLIAQVVAAVTGIDGALSIEQAEDLIDEVVHLNASRPRTYFHAGFLSAVTRKDDKSPLEDNNERRGWRLSGYVMGLARQQRWDELSRFAIDRRSDIDRVLPADARPMPRFVALTRKHLFEALFHTGRTTESFNFLSPEVVAALGPSFLADLFLRSQHFLLERRQAEARLGFDIIQSALLQLPSNQLLPETLLFEIRRRIAQLKRAEGDFPGAIQQFEALLRTSAQDDRGRLQVDVGLARGAFRWLADVQVPLHEEKVSGILSRIQLGKSDFEGALGHGAETTNAHYVFGVRALLNKEWEIGLRHLELAYEGAGQREANYRGSLYARIRLYYGLALLLCLDESRFGYALELLRAAKADMATDQWPNWLVREAGQVVVYGTQACVEVLEFLVDELPAIAAPHLGDPQVLARIPRIERLVQQRAGALNADPLRRFGDYSALAKHYLTHGSLPEAEDALDRMEDLAARDTRARAALLELLQSPGAFSPVFEEEDVWYLRARLFELDGKYAEAGSHILALVHAHAGRGEWDEACGLADRLQAYGAEPELARQAKARAAARPREEVSESGNALHEFLEKRGSLHILFVGGNEEQAQYDGAVRSILERRAPGVSVEFVHTGWTSNWGEQLNDMKGKIDRSDGLVIMRFIRTTLGRNLRRISNDEGKPWGACTGHGRDSVVRSIEALAERIASMRLRNAN